MTPPTHRPITRRRLLQGAATLALVRALPSVAAPELPDIPLLRELIGARTPRWERLRMELPARTVQAIHLFSEKNPVPDMAVFEFPVAPDKVEIDTRVRLAGSQKVVAIGVMSDGGLYAASAEVIVTIAACLDGS